MILRDLRAEGFMRYELLELGDLPRGVIGIVGENEAGKTTIGEAVAFALFGRTIRTEGTDPTQAIHWERDECRTRVSVELPGRGVHRVERLVARTGEFEARLLGPDGAVLAEGPRRVSEALQRLLGFDFSTFRYSFYVAQHELDLLQREGRDNARRIVYDMLGITTVERARTQLEREHEEARERLSTLERDLLVAQALHGEALPVREELGQLEQQLAQARARHAEALTAEQRTRLAREQAEKAVEAERERTAGLQRVEAALVASAERQNLLGALRRLEALAEQGAAHLHKVEAAARDAEAPRRAARDALEQAQAVDRAAQSLAALVAARRDQLEHEVAVGTGGPDSLPARREREAATIAREQRSMTWRTVWVVLCLLLALAAVGVALAGVLPREKPALAIPSRTLHLPSIGFSWELNADRLVPPLAGVGGVFLLLGAWALVSRVSHARRARAAEEELARLSGLDATGRGELEACKTTQVLGPLSALEKGLEPVRAQNVKDALAALRRAAGPHMDGRASPAELLSEAQARVTKHDVAARDAEGALAEARRVETFTRRSLDEVRETIKVAFPEGVPQAAPVGGEAPPTAQALESEAQRVLGQAVRARIELAALEGGKRVAPVGETVQALKAALVKGFEAHGGDAAAARARYEEQSGLPELLRARAEAPGVDDLRAVVRRERELLVELLGDEGTLRTGLQQAEGAARRAREELVHAQVALDDARTRSERLAQSRRRLDELETKVRELGDVVVPGRRDLAVQREALSLLDELATSLRARFVPGIARYIELVLPRLTNGRYRRVRIDPELDIRIFSPERGDFVRLVDLSLGTADQVLLALRLGLARALVASRGIGGGHFLFLDEPLVSADAAREHAFLDLLRTFDEEFAQIFVTSPRAMDEGPFVRTIELARDVRVQRLTGARAGGEGAPLGRPTEATT